jgi:hypothetical protein
MNEEIAKFAIDRILWLAKHSPDHAVQLDAAMHLCQLLRTGERTEEKILSLENALKVEKERASTAEAHVVTLAELLKSEKQAKVDPTMRTTKAKDAK